MLKAKVGLGLKNLRKNRKLGVIRKLFRFCFNSCESIDIKHDISEPT